MDIVRRTTIVTFWWFMIARSAARRLGSRRRPTRNPLCLVSRGDHVQASLTVVRAMAQKHPRTVSAQSLHRGLQ